MWIMLARLYASLAVLFAQKKIVPRRLSLEDIRKKQQVLREWDARLNKIINSAH